ncbi:unnamed protein product [Parnassius mnemosyne]|uniref:Uncharacterized protein n=1 Tax=Parnassius mnemosyne TaxID=213953 RepID=A0AAV1L8W1_9NEOP
MEDGTRDKHNPENIALAIRYVKYGVINESLLMVKAIENLDAATFTELTLNTLTENNIDPSCMLSQCYNGASRLLEQGWSGHLAVTKVVYDNYSSILRTLKEIKYDRFNGDDVAKSIGIKKVMLDLEFRKAMVVAKKSYPRYNLQTQLCKPEAQD